MGGRVAAEAAEPRRISLSRWRTVGASHRRRCWTQDRDPKETGPAGRQSSLPVLVHTMHLPASVPIGRGAQASRLRRLSA